MKTINLILTSAIAIAATALQGVTDCTGDSAKTALSISLQALIDSAKPGDTIDVPPGVYREKILVPMNRKGLVIRGGGKAVVTWDDFAGRKGPDGTDLGTFRSYTMKIEADDVSLSGLTIVNTASDENVANGGRGVGQAVALHVDGDRIVVRDCTIRSYQDTLYTTQSGGMRPNGELPTERNCRQYFENCRIEGSVDFIFGHSTALFENCDLVLRIAGVVTAAATPEGQPFGYVMHKCRISAPNDQKSILGRPWRGHAQTVFLDCEIGDCLKPVGWTTWRPNDGRDKTAYYAEFGCRGPGADLSSRPAWTHNSASDRDAYFASRNCRSIPFDMLKGSDGWTP